MRSRFAAFALGLGEYLLDTLAAEHPDRGAAREAAVRDLSRIRERQRFMRLAILHESATDAEGEVLFLAGIFEKGIDRSFAELSRFVREDGHWRYESGVSLSVEHLPKDPSRLDRDAFLALAARRSEKGP
jgi:SEC-C motif-containing protein